MKSTVLAAMAFLTASTNAAALSARGQAPQWHISDFSVESINNGATMYHLKLEGEGECVVCEASNKVKSTTCPGADEPAPFPPSPCGKDRRSGFQWEFQNTTSPLAGGGEAFFIKFIYNHTPGKPVLYGCSGLFEASNSSCLGPPGKGQLLHVPSSFDVQPSTKSQCVYV